MAIDILVVDDEPDIRELISGVLEDEGFEVRNAGTAEAALDLVRERAPALAIVDVWLAGSSMDGLDLLGFLKGIDSDLPVLVISGHGNIEMAVSAIQSGAYDFLEKPFRADRLLHLVGRALEAVALRRENEKLKGAYSRGAWEGTSSQAQTVRAQISKLALTNARILLSGPVGAGKELAGRLIHETSERRDGPFSTASIATMPADTMEVALFGQEDSDGTPIRLGLLERAHGGTLLLDEVSELTPGAQARLLRVLAEQTFKRVGGLKPVSVDVRVLSTTTRQSQGETGKGEDADGFRNFRADLYHRLAVVKLPIPPLNRRREDIPALIRLFTERIAETSGLARRDFSDEAVAVLQAMDWPGNVRQLRNMVERVLILSPADITAPVTPDDLKQDLVRDGETGLPQSSDLVSLTLRDARETFERQYLSLQVRRFDGNISRTAQFIGMERSALHRKLKNLGVDVTQGRSGDAS